MILYIFLFFLVWTSIGSIFTENLDRITVFKRNNVFDIKENYIFDTHFRFLFLFGSVFCYLFLNTIRKRRRIYYYKNRLKHLENMKNWQFIGDEYDKEILKFKRALKLEKLNKRKWLLRLKS